MKAWGRAAVRGALATILLVTGGVAGAQYDDEPLPTWYVGPLAGFATPDTARDSRTGINLQLVGGYVFAESVAVELTAFGTKFDSNTDGGPETELTGGGLNLALGTPAGGNPLFLIGGGSVQHSIADVKQSETYAELGLGIYLPFTIGGELWRVEGRYQAIFTDHPALPDEDMVEDLRVNLGFLFAFGREQPQPAADSEVETVGEAVAIADEDGDGVADAIDQCPGTPAWVRPDANGCTPDSDGDGVDEAHDDCPGTPPGTTVDADGCEPRAAPMPAADADRDGVEDAIDACPHTVPKFNVDAKGCLVPEDVTLRNVHFDSSSSRLTGDGYQLLRSVAASLNAQPGIRLEVSGHADSSGGAKMNQELSRERARVVRNFLTYLGIAGDRLTLKAYGEDQPLTDNKTKESRSYNRRVQFRRLDQ